MYICQMCFKLAYLFFFIGKQTLGQTCYTPDKQQGRCVPLNECPEAFPTFANPPKGSETHLRQFLCKDDQQLKVCCGTTANLLENYLQSDYAKISKKIVERHAFMDVEWEDECESDPSHIDLPLILAESVDSEVKPKKCLGILANSRYVITPAQCVGQQFRLVGVQFRGKNNNYVTFGVEEITSHPFFDAVSGVNDVALLRLNQTVSSDDVAVFCRDSYWSDEEGVFIYTNVDLFTIVRGLEKTTFLIASLSKEDCEEEFLQKGAYRVVTEYDLCTNNLQNATKFTCNEFTGVPLFSDWDNGPGFVGFSSSRTVCHDGLPDIYTNVNAYEDWLIDQMRPWPRNNETEICVTPRNKLGTCIPITSCDVLYQLVQQRPVSQQNVDYLRASQCGFDGNTPKVCCPAEKSIPYETEICVTPRNKWGTCIPIRSCDVLYQLLQQPPVSQQNVDYLRASQCGFDGNTPKVCCPAEKSIPYETCYTPDKQQGHCVPLHECPKAFPTFANPPKGSEIHLQQFLCKDDQQLKVCCGTTPNFKLLENYADIFKQPIERDAFMDVQDDECESEPLSHIDLPLILAESVDSEVKPKKCLGILANSRYVITPAQCVGQQFRLLGVQFRGKNNNSVTFGVEEIISHPFFDPVSGVNDVALLRLNQTVSSDDVAVVCQDSDWSDEEWVSIYTNVDLFTIERGLNKTTFLIAWFSKEDCEEEFLQKGAYRVVTEYDLCTNNLQNATKFTCNEFTGVPLFSDSDIGPGFVGFSSSRTVCDDGLPDIYTNVNAYADWLIDQMTPRPTNNENQSCVTPRNKRGTCIPIRSCDVLYQLLQQRPVSQANVDYLRASQCGFDGNTPQVCCPTEKGIPYETCYTPDKQRGHCVPLHECPEAFPTFANPPKGSETQLQRFLCKDDQQLKVCCGATKLKLFEKYLISDYANISRQALKRDAFMVAQEDECESDPSHIDLPLILAEGVDSEVKPKKCLGILANSRYVITPAQCVGQQFRLVGVQFRGKNNNSITFGVEEIISHPFFDPVSGVNDVALLRLNQTVSSDDVAVFCRNIRLWYGYHWVYIDTNVDLFTIERGLNKTTFSILTLSEEDCKEEFIQKGALPLVTEYDLCTNNLQNATKFTCNEFTGVPLFIDSGKPGFVGFSSSRTVCDDGLPDIYTNVNAYEVWLIDQMKPWATNNDPCTTPNGEIGECWNVLHCPALLDASSDITNEAEAISLLDFICENGKGEFSVCCVKSSNSTVIHRKDEAEPIEMPTNFLETRLCGLQHRDDYFTSSTAVAIDEFPWIARIKGGFRFYCTGTLINSRYVLSTAECAHDPNYTIVRLGAYRKHRKKSCVKDPDVDATDCTETEEYGVEDIVMHPFYFRYIRLNAIALLRLNKTVSYYTDFIRPICLPVPGTLTAKVGDTMYMSSWGTQITASEFIIKKKVLTQLLKTEECQQLIGKEIASTTFCTQDDEDDQDKSDEGGALMFHDNYRWHIEGILVLNKDRKGPVLYVNVSRYINWILNNMKSW